MQHIFRKLKRQRTAHTKRFKRLRKHPFAAPAGLFTGLLLLSGIVVAILHHKQAVTFRPDSSFVAIISHDGNTQTVPTNEPSVGSLLNKLGVKLSSRDRVEPDLSTPIEQDNLRINIYRATPVSVVDGATTANTYTAAATPRSIATDAGVKLYPEDRVALKPVDDFVSTGSLGEQVTITRAVPVNLNVYGTVLPSRTTAKTVGELLKAKNVKVNPKDTVLPGASTPITANMQVLVVRNGTQIVTETQAIAAPAQTVTDASLSFGSSAVRQQGSPGTQVLTYQVERKNGVEVGRTLLQTVVTVPPVPQVVAKGQAVTIPADKQAVMAQAGIAASDYAYVDYIASREGGWCPTKVQGSRTCPGYAPSPIPSGGGYGIFQATPGGKMASAGGDWATSAVTQIRWATGYATGRYGSWAGAYNYWVSHHNW